VVNLGPAVSRTMEFFFISRAMSVIKTDSIGTDVPSSCA
jgi:hypothetical protein